MQKLLLLLLSSQSHNRDRQNEQIQEMKGLQPAVNRAMKNNGELLLLLTLL